MISGDARREERAGGDDKEDSEDVEEEVGGGSGVGVEPLTSRSRLAEAIAEVGGGRMGLDSKSKQVKRTTKLITIERRQEAARPLRPECYLMAWRDEDGGKMEVEEGREEEEEEKKRKKHKSWTGLIGSMRVTM